MRTRSTTTIRSMIVAAAAAALVLCAAPAAEARPDRPGRHAQRAPAKRERVKQRIRLMRALVLTEELQLDDATAARLVPVLNRFDDEVEKLLRERNQLRDQIRATLDAGDDRKLDGLIDKLVANQRARWDAEQRRFEELRELLSPRQAARLLDVLPEIDRRILRGLRGGPGVDPGRPRPGRRPGRPGRPGRVRPPGPMPDDVGPDPFR